MIRHVVDLIAYVIAGVIIALAFLAAWHISPWLPVVVIVLVTGAVVALGSLRGQS